MVIVVPVLPQVGWALSVMVEAQRDITRAPSPACKDVHLALQAADNDQLAARACLADEWQQVVDDRLGDQDLTVVTRTLEH